VAVWGRFYLHDDDLPEPEPPKNQNQDIVAFARKHLSFEPDEKQVEVLRSKAKRGILNCTRQWGKSTTAAVMAVHRAYTEDACVVLVASPSARQSAELVEKARQMLLAMGIAAHGDGHNDISLQLPNGSRIVGLPENAAKFRGFSAVSLMLIDEAAQVADHTYKSLRPMLAVSDGDLWLMSTPYGKRGFFYESWANGGEEWTRFSVKATECPRIGADFLEEERREMGAAWFGQEYMTEFIDNGEAVFGRDVVDNAFDDDVDPLWPS
jgi:hypothetical protein